MSGCSCDHPAGRRISDEYDGLVQGDVRLRCLECGGKAGMIDAHALVQIGIPLEKIEASAAAGPYQVTIEFGDFDPYGDDHEDPPEEVWNDG